METITKIFGQVKPSATTLTDLCVIGAGKEGQGTVKICNQTTAAETVRVAHVPSGESIDPKHYVIYDLSIPANGGASDSFDLPAGATIKVYSAAGHISFTAEGMEVTT